MPRHLAPAAVALWAMASATLANDSVAEKGAGGLILVHADAVTMEKEELYVSPSEVRVDYLFRNNENTDHTYLVAFPMPDIDPDDYLESDNGIPDKNSDNFMDFKVKAAGVEVTPELEMRAQIAGIDITARLTALGIPLNPLADATRDKLKAVPHDRLAELTTMGAIRYYEDTAEPEWSLRSTYYWTQTFPANAGLAVSHVYKPAVGGTFFTTESLSDDYYAKTYCVDADTAKALRKKLAALPDQNMLLVTSLVDYILTTGANWGGSIGDFRLVVDKEKPDAIVSFCMDRVKKIAPTQFEVRRKDFFPDKDLKVLIVNTPPPAE
jgi:hypothetical protein